MKKRLTALLATLAAVALFGACDGLNSLPFFNNSTDSESIADFSSESQSSSLEQSSESQSSSESSSASSSEESSSISADSSNEENSSSEQDPPPVKQYLYQDFTAAEKKLFTQYIGEVIPFAPNDEYYVEGYYEETDYENGMSFYTLGNTQDDFDDYLEKFSDYELIETYQDDYGDTWYCYEKGNLVVDVSYYYYEEEYWIDLYVYSRSLSANVSELLTNADKGLPTDADGVYDVDFSKAQHVKSVADQSYYLNGCPTVSNGTADPAVLVIPVEFSDVTAASKGYTVDKIKAAFNGTGDEVDYYSIHDYYYISSYGKLDLDITVVDSWFKPKYSSSYYINKTQYQNGVKTPVGDQWIMDEALSYLEDKMDLTKFDSDNNGIIDSVVLINTLDADSSVRLQWAYRYWNILSDGLGNYYEYDGVFANDYLWASYQFLHEGKNSNGGTSFDHTEKINTYTYIHEFGHILGADDYYDTAYVGSPMDGYDVMDDTMGDHNAFTKFNYGWLTTSRLVVAEDSVTLTLEDFSKNGDTVIIANNWDNTLGAYQEYYIVAYYTNNGLNAGDYGYFSKEGIVVYHVNASLYVEESDGQTYYDVYNNNTDESDPDGYGTEDDLIEYVKTANGEYVYEVGDSLSSSTTDDQGNRIAYTFVVDSLTDKTATLTFTKTE